MNTSTPRRPEREREHPLPGDQHLCLASAITAAAPTLRRYIARLVRDFDDAEDIFQETCVRAFMFQHTYSARGSFAGWMRRIAYHVHLQRVRVAKTTHAKLQALTDSQAEACDSLEAEAIRTALRRDRLESLVAHAVQLLPPRQRLILTAYYYEGRRVRDVAELYGICDGTVMATLAKGRAAIARMLRRCSEDAD